LSSEHIKNVYLVLVPFFRGYAYFFGNLNTNGAKLRAVNQCFDFVTNALGGYCVCHCFNVLLLIVRQIYVANLIHKENIFVNIVNKRLNSATGAAFIVEN